MAVGDKEGRKDGLQGVDLEYRAWWNNRHRFVFFFIKSQHRVNKWSLKIFTEWVGPKARLYTRKCVIQTDKELVIETILWKKPGCSI